MPTRFALPGPTVSPWRRTIRYWLSRLAVFAIARAYLRIRPEGLERLPDGPAIYAFNHLSWLDPFVLMAILPFRPRLYFFGPKEEDMAVGGRNRLMLWTGTAIPYKPGKNDLLEATRHVAAVIERGGVVAIAGEGRIGAIENELWPLNDGPAFFALRSGVPLVPIAINGTTWVSFGHRVRVRVGEPIVATGRPDRARIAATTETLRERLMALIADAPPVPEPGRLGRRFTESFDDWPEGSRAATIAAARAAAASPGASAAGSPAAASPAAASPGASAAAGTLAEADAEAAPGG